MKSFASWTVTVFIICVDFLLTYFAFLALKSVVTCQVSDIWYLLLWSISEALELLYSWDIKEVKTYGDYP